METTTRLFRHRYIILSVLVSYLFIGLISWIIQFKIMSAARTSNENVLTTVVGITHQAVQTWFNEQKSETLIWANNSKLRRFVDELLLTPRKPRNLIEAPAQANLRAWLEPVIIGKDYRGFFIIGPEGISLASSRDANTGIPSPLHKQKEFLRKIWSGQPALSIPQPSLVPLRDQTGQLVTGLPTMFVGAPIKNNAGKIIAVLTFRIDPTVDFTVILQRGRIGTSGETYAFDNKGRMISESRFKPDLYDIGIIDRGQNTDTTIDIRDPGVNLVAGERIRTPREQQPLTHMAKRATAGESGVNSLGYRDYRGVPVIGAWVWNKELSLGITSEIDVEEVYADARSNQFTVTLTAIVLASFIAGLAIIFVRNREYEEAEREGTERRKILRDILENVSQGVIMFDADRKLLAWNQQFEDIHLFPQGELVEGTSIWEMAYSFAEKGLYGEGDLEEIANKRVEFLWGSKSTRSDFMFHNEKIFDVISQQTPNGELVITYTDVTRRKEAESKVVEQRDELEKINQQKTRLFSIISHDFRSPFTALLGYSEIMSNTLDTLSHEKIVEYSQSINLAGHQLHTLMNNLLEWSRSQMNQVPHKPAPQNIRTLVQQSIDLFKMVAENKKISLENSAEEVLAMADPDMTNTIMRNLLSNAIKFTPAHGRVTVSSDQNGDWVTIKVSDTGNGISAERINELFKLETNRSTRGTQGEQGTGLGLVLCKEFAEQQGGTISVSSTQGQGATFQFTLPLVIDNPLLK